MNESGNALYSLKIPNLHRKRLRFRFTEPKGLNSATWRHTQASQFYFLFRAKAALTVCQSPAHPEEAWHSHQLGEQTYLPRLDVSTANAW